MSVIARIACLGVMRSSQNRGAGTFERWCGSPANMAQPTVTGVSVLVMPVEVIHVEVPWLHAAQPVAGSVLKVALSSSPVRTAPPTKSCRLTWK